MEIRRREINELVKYIQPFGDELPRVNERVEEIGDKFEALCGILEAQGERVSLHVDLC
jgi:hypothetical protein